MNQAEELLNSMSSEIPIHSHPVPDTDTYFIIDPITRQIENTNPKPVVIMQYDHNSERFTFELPRYVDGHDMLNCTSVTVNVDNIEVVESGYGHRHTNSDAPDMIDLRLNPNDPEKVISSWLISRNSTQLAGHLRFHIEYKCVDSEGNVVYEWSTDNYDEVEVRARKKNGEAAVIEHTDLLEQWRTRIFGAGDSVLADIVSEGNAQVAAVKAESETQLDAVELKGAQTLDSIPEDYTEVDAMAEEAVRTKGDAIVCNAAGESIVLKDSSNDHIHGLKLLGRSTQNTTKGVQLLDFNVHQSGTASLDYLSLLKVCNPFTKGAGTYTFNCTGTIGNTYRLWVYNNNDELIINRPSGDTFTLTDEQIASVAYIRIVVGTLEVGATYDGYIYPTISYGSQPREYEPYTGGEPSPNPDYPQEIVNIENPTVNICGKNLVRTNNDKDVTYEGLHFLITKGLSEIVLNGTTTKSYGYAISEGTYLAPGRYTMSVYGLNNVSTKHDHAYVMNTLTRKIVCSEVKTGSPVTFEVTEGGVHRIDFLFAEGTTYNNATIRFQIEAGSEATEYEPYKPVQTITLPNTQCGIPVTSGGNYTDSDGQQWICDEIDLERGVYIQRVCQFITDKGSNWSISGTSTTDYNVFFRMNDDYGLLPIGFNNPVICTHFAMTKDPVVNWNTGICAGLSNAVLYFSVPKSKFPDLETWGNYVAQQAANGTPITTYGVLRTPIETPLTAEEITAFKSLRTNYPDTTILNDAGAWMSVKYNADTKAYVDKPRTLKLVDSNTGVVYELKIVDGNIVVTPTM